MRTTQGKPRRAHIGSSAGLHISQEMVNDPALREPIFEAREKRKLAASICRLRKQRGLTQKDLAQMAGVSQAYIARIEKSIEVASSLPSIDAYFRLLNFLGYRVDVQVKRIKLAT